MPTQEGVPKGLQMLWSSPCNAIHPPPWYYRPNIAWLVGKSTEDGNTNLTLKYQITPPSLVQNRDVSAYLTFDGYGKIQIWALLAHLLTYACLGCTQMPQFLPLSALPMQHRLQCLANLTGRWQHCDWQDCFETLCGWKLTPSFHSITLYFSSAQSTLKNAGYHMQDTADNSSCAAIQNSLEKACCTFPEPH